MVVTKSALVGGYYLFWVSESQFPPDRSIDRYWKIPLEFGDRVVVVIDMESGQRFIIRCEAAIPLPALVHVLS